MQSSSSYLPFARKYRPNNLLELRGQETLVKILDYSIRERRLASAYLLTGIRGVGKTTTARIIASTINCSQPILTTEFITPCKICDNCNGVTHHNHPDILEIDAASNTGVDDIRRIIESSEYRPLLGRYKVFIIDEVHMLSRNAFNALLKILEEPPEHIIFIFATTEVQKIPITVLSRCQRYDLRRFSFDEIYSLLKHIEMQENLSIVPEALKIISRCAEGSARDAISVLDQVTNLAFIEGKNEVTLKIVNDLLGYVSADIIIEFFQAILRSDTKEAIKLVGAIYSQSINLENFVELAADFIAYLSKLKIINDYSEPIYASYEKEIKEISLKTDIPRLSILWQIFSKATGEIKISHNQLIALEMLAIKACLAHSLSMFEVNDKKKDDFDLTSLVQSQDQASSDAQRQIPKPQDLACTISPLNEPILNEPIIKFLKYLKEENEIEIYYSLMNEVEIKKFTANTISQSKLDNEFQDKAAERTLVREHSFDPQNSLGSFKNGELCNILEFVTNNPTISKLKTKIISLLFAMTGEKWDVIIGKQEEIVNLKAIIKEEIISSESWKLINDNFAQAGIKDIYIKK